ncbi:cell cycle checkpoint protein RAD1 isoform X1 [Nomia melanderi]|uniref:cell cycle checkpoint protein RAD1 isoform X1 n=1 Tax=Nomia melanderi TaxID=2448451 RepID=UPI003FCD56AD
MFPDVEGHKLVAKLGNLKTIVQLLKAINFKESATCFGTENGLKLTVEDVKCMQASAYIPSHVFQEFTLQEDVIFRINLNVLVECLCMFWSNINSQGSSVTFQLFYKGTGYPVTVLIEEDGIITDCSLKTQEPDELLDFHLEPENVLNKVVLQTELLKDILSELDPTSDLIELLLSPSAPYFRISTAGLAGICHVELPHDGDLVDSFQCASTATSSYKLSHIKPAMKALACANKVSLRTDVCGLLCFQYMVKTDEGHTCYIEYYVRVNFFLSYLHNQKILNALYKHMKNILSDFTGDRPR